MNKNLTLLIVTLLSLFCFQTVSAAEKADTLYKLTTTGAMPDEKAGTCTGGSWSESGVNSTDDTTETPKRWTMKSTGAYICCQLNNALKEGDAITILGTPKSNSSDGFNIRTTEDSKTYVAQIKSNTKTKEQNAKYTIEANSELIGKTVFYIGLTTQTRQWWLKSISVTGSTPASIESITMSEYGINTYSNSQYAVDFSETSAKAYIFTGVNSDNSMVCKEVTKVPAQTGVIIVAEKNSTVSPKFTIDADDMTGNVLVADDGTTTADENTYILASKNSQVGFYKANSSRTLTAGKAHYEKEATAAATSYYSLIFGNDGTTGISQLSTETTSANGNEIFNLAGQRVGKDYKGVVIKNGKKYIQK